MSDNDSSSHEYIKDTITQSISTNIDRYWKTITEVHAIRTLPIPDYDYYLSSLDSGRRGNERN